MSSRRRPQSAGAGLAPSRRAERVAATTVASTGLPGGAAQGSTSATMTGGKPLRTAPSWRTRHKKGEVVEEEAEGPTSMRNIKVQNSLREQWRDNQLKGRVVGVQEIPGDPSPAGAGFRAAWTRGGLLRAEKDDLNQQLRNFAAWGEAGQCKRMLKLSGVNVNAVDEYATTALHQATTLETAVALTDAGADVHAKNKWGSTPLHTAASTGRVDVVQHLLHLGAKANVRNNLGMAPLHTAGSVGVITALCKGGAITVIRDRKGFTPLHWASKRQIVDTLLSVGADIDAQCYDGNTPLMIACERGRVEAVRALLASKPSITLKNFFNETALDIASQRPNKAVVTLLLDQYKAHLHEVSHKRDPRSLMEVGAEQRAEARGETAAAGKLTASLRPHVMKPSSDGVHKHSYGPQATIGGEGGAPSAAAAAAAAFFSGGAVRGAAAAFASGASDGRTASASAAAAAGGGGVEHQAGWDATAYATGDAAAQGWYDEEGVWHWSTETTWGVDREAAGYGDDSGTGWAGYGDGYEGYVDPSFTENYTVPTEATTVGTYATQAHGFAPATGKAAGELGTAEFAESLASHPGVVEAVKQRNNVIKRMATMSRALYSERERADRAVASATEAIKESKLARSELILVRRKLKRTEISLKRATARLNALGFTLKDEPKESASSLEAAAAAEATASAKAAADRL